MAYGDATPTEPGIPWEEFETLDYFYRMESLADEWYATFKPYPGIERYSYDGRYVSDEGLRAWERDVGPHLEDLEALQKLERQDLERRIAETARRMVEHFDAAAGY